MAEWCIRHGYEFNVVGSFSAEKTLARGGCRTEPPWPKIQEIIDHLPGCDWLVWLDADVFIRDLDFDVRTLLVGSFDFLVSRYSFLDFYQQEPYPMQLEKGGEICIGSMAVRNTQGMTKFLQEWLVTQRVPDRTDLTDQGALLKFVRDDSLPVSVKYAYEGVFVDYAVPECDRGAPGVHFCTGSVEAKRDRIRALLGKGFA